MYFVIIIIINFEEKINRSFPELRLDLNPLELELKCPELELELKLFVSSGIGIEIENNGIGIGIELKKWNWPPTLLRIYFFTQYRSQMFSYCIRKDQMLYVLTVMVVVLFLNSEQSLVN